MSQRTSVWKAFAVLMLIATPAAALEEHSAESAWRDCVLQKAADFAKGRDAAPIIVEGALDACFDQQKAYGVAYRAIATLATRSEMGPRAASDISARAGIVQGTVDAIKDKRREIGAAALITVLQYRALH